MTPRHVAATSEQTTVPAHTTVSLWRAGRQLNLRALSAPIDRYRAPAEQDQRNYAEDARLLRLVLLRAAS